MPCLPPIHGRLRHGATSHLAHPMEAARSRRVSANLKVQRTVTRTVSRGCLPPTPPTTYSARNLADESGHGHMEHTTRTGSLWLALAVAAAFALALLIGGVFDDGQVNVNTDDLVTQLCADTPDC
jgi:hypothetical protein